MSSFILQCFSPLEDSAKEKYETKGFPSRLQHLLGQGRSLGHKQRMLQLCRDWRWQQLWALSPGIACFTTLLPGSQHIQCQQLVTVALSTSVAPVHILFRDCSQSPLPIAGKLSLVYLRILFIFTSGCPDVSTANAVEGDMWTHAHPVSFWALMCELMCINQEPRKQVLLQSKIWAVKC